MNRCVATNADGARCMYRAEHGPGFHLYPDDPSAFAYRYGRLEALVQLFLNGKYDGAELARQCAEIESTLPEDDPERAERLIEAAGLLAEKLVAAPPTVVDYLSVYLRDGNDTVYLAERAAVRDPEDAAPLYRLTVEPGADEEPTPVVKDLMVALEESIAAAKRTLGEGAL